jgi:hypothetical protein
VSNNPANHKFISDKEKAYIIEKTADIILSAREKKVRKLSKKRFSKTC